jgi:predicted house-cleaning noncanonical NTP pyrophosphatase (MazG superfamily)
MPKLVRDLIPTIITKQGKTPISRILNVEEYKEELAIKLLEEAQEFHSDKNIEELADIIEVFDAIIKAYGFTYEELKIARDRKNIERGKFEKMIFLEDIIS